MSCPDSLMLVELLSQELTTFAELILEEDPYVMYYTLDDLAVELQELEEE